MPRALASHYQIPAEQRKKWAPFFDAPQSRLVPFLNRERVNKGATLLPGIQSDDPKTLGMMVKIVTRATEAAPARILDGGIAGPNAMTENFYSGLTVTGYTMNPTTVPPMDNEPIREKLGLGTSFATDRHRAIFDKLVDEMFGSAVPAKLKMRRVASMGCPRYTNTMEIKHELINYALDNLERLLDLVDNHDLESLYSEFELVIAYSLGGRVQADSITRNADGTFSSKPREVNDELAARSSFKQGQRFNADKTVVINGIAVPNHFAGRYRAVYALSFVVNYVIAAFANSWRDAYSEKFEFTWKHRTREEKLAKVSSFHYFCGFDVKQFDQSVGKFLVDRWIERMKEYADPRFMELVRLCFSAPFIAPYPYVAGTSDKSFNPLFGEDPFNASLFTAFYGLPSGIALVSDLGKFFMMFAYLCVADDYFHDVLEFGVSGILKGRNPNYAFLNMGDDCVGMTNHAGFYTYLDSEKYAAHYFKIAKENGIAFLGDIIYKTEVGKLDISPNMASYIKNRYAPERGIDAKSRAKFWAIGMLEQAAAYAKAPAYSVIKDIEDEEVYNAFKRTPTSLIREYYDAQKAYSKYSYIDLMVLENPDYLHYKYTEDMIENPEVLEMINTSIPADKVWSCISKYVRH